MSDEFRMWRCTRCAKWSHGGRKPKYHQRAVYEQPKDAATIVRHDPGHAGSEYIEAVPDLWWIRCGPFAQYAARPVGDE